MDTLFSDNFIAGAKWTEFTVSKITIEYRKVPNKDMKKIIWFKSGQIFRKDANCSENDFKSYFNFSRLLFFLDMVDFLYGWPYTKSTIPQKLKVGKIWNMI